MEIKKYLGDLLYIIKRQKILVFVGSLILVMAISVMLLSGNNSTSSQKITPNSLAQNQTQPGATQPSTSNPDAPLPPNSPFTTKFIYFIGGLFNHRKKTVQTPNQNGNSPQYYGSGSITGTQTAPAQQSHNNNPSNQSGTSGSGGSNTSNNGGSSGNQQNNTNPFAPSPTPATIINIVFKDENGNYWTYVPPAIPPIDTQWVKYTNNQDHYSIEYPADWIVVKSNYNVHEGITIYTPGSSGEIDKPSIAFVGWKADYLNSSASYTGPITLNNIPGTIYTNGPFGPSSVAAVFQYQYGYFALGSSTSNDIFMYVFDHMLRSLNFNI